MVTHFTFCALNELGVVARGKSKHRPRNAPGLYGGAYPFIQTGDVKHANFYITDFSQTYNEKGLAQSKLWNPGTLCITIAANIADTAILKIPACFPDSIIGFIPFSDKSDVKFIKYYLDAFKIQIESISHGTTQDNLSLEKLLSIKMRVPSLPTQKKIAAVLSAYDDLIENNTRRIALLERMAEELYKEWFVRMRFPGHAQTRFVKGIPEGWDIKEVKALDLSIIDGDRGTNYPRKDEFFESGFCLFLNTGNIKNDKFDFSKCDFITQNKDSSLRKGKLSRNDIILTTRGTIGSLAFYCSKIEHEHIRINSGMLVLRAHKPHEAIYYYSLFKSAYMKEQYFLFASGSAQPQLPIRDLKKIKILLPPSDLLTKFHRIATPIQDEIDLLSLNNQKASKTRDRLLTRLISGKLSVEDLDIAFPPSMLEDEIVQQAVAQKTLEPFL
jgi:type I restriction enzyme, S subunit